MRNKLRQTKNRKGLTSYFIEYNLPVVLPNIFDCVDPRRDPRIDCCDTEWLCCSVCVWEGTSQHSPSFLSGNGSGTKSLPARTLTGYSISSNYPAARAPSNNKD
eukprot:scaffold112586_cov17-Tisochrysis_lutea.AAC.1